MHEHWTPARTQAWLRTPQPHDDKYRRGVLRMRTGSAQYPGAAVLGVMAAWGTGIGIVDFAPGVETTAPAAGLPSTAAAVLATHPETVIRGTLPYNAAVIGSGTDPARRSAAETAALHTLLTGTAPVVVDAGALELVPQVAVRTHSGERAPLLLTPHSGEFTRLWAAAASAGVTGLTGVAPGWVTGRPETLRHAVDAAIHLADRLAATVLLKGSTTVIASPHGTAYTTGPATPWLATAGTGDVLAGILGALIAGAHAASGTHATPHADPADLADTADLAGLAATGAILHDLAARIAADDPLGTGEGHPVTAAQIARALPQAWRELRGSA